jgi:hypothetical protein
MARVEQFFCDREGCKKFRAGERSLEIYSHSTPDGSGNGSDDWQACADLCPEHLLAFTQYLIGLIEDKKVPAKLKDVFEKFNVKAVLR